MYKATKALRQEVSKKLVQQVADLLPKAASGVSAVPELHPKTGAQPPKAAVHLPKTAPPVPITINNKRIEADPSWTVQEAARQAGIFVPTVCNHPRLKPAGRCKVCTVHVTEGDTSMYKLACCTKVTPEMKVTTDSLAVRSKADLALKTLLKPLGKTATVPRGLTEEMDKLLEWENTSLVDTSSPSLVRDNNLCVGCSRCVRACSDLQGMNILEASMEDQGYQIATTVCGNHLNDTDCILCGQCSVFCPTGAIVEKDDVPKVIAALESKKILMLQTAPATRVALAECFGAPPGTVATAKLVGAAKAAGFSYVFDTNFAADLTIMEEGTEFLNRLEKGGPFPMFTSCCPAWINMAEKKYPEYLKNLSTCKSPQMMMGAVLKKYWADRMGIDASRIFSVSIMPCTAKKDELSRPQLQHDGIADVDVALTTREFARLLQQRGISDFNKVPELPYDDPLGQTSGAAALFGVTGGVMEAALRTAFEAKTGQTLPKMEFHACRGLDGIKEATVDVGGAKLNIAIASGGKNIQKVMEWVKKGQKEYHFVEMMACPSGCIGGGGQPRSDDPEVLTRRMESIYQLDHNAVIRKSHENPAVKRIYTDFFDKPNSRLSHQLLHTHYTNRMKPKVEAHSNGPVKKEASAGSGLLILFGSQSGTAAGAARQLKESYERKKPGSKVRCMAMNNYNFVDLPKESHIIMVCSTYGEGVFPDNAAEFWEKLKDPNLSDDWLKNVHFSICGLGSSAYTYFNKAAKDLDRRFEELGGIRLCPSVFAGERATEKYAATFDPWSEALMSTLGGGADSINEPQAPQYQLTLALDSKRRNLRPCPPGYHFIHLTEKYRLTSPADYPRPADFLDLDLTGSGMTYKAGAHLAILPRNRPEQVASFLDFAGLDGDKLVSIHVVNGEPSEIPPVLTVRELFEQYMDLSAPVSRKFMLQLAVFANEKEAADLRRICAKPKSVEFETFLQEYTHEDVLRMFPSALPPIESLISMVPIIKSRKYSIASSSRLYPNSAHLAVVLWQGLLPSGKKRIGLCSDYLLNLDPSKRPVLAAAMHEGILAAPEDPATPCMFIALGTGIASVRAFLQEREGMKKAGMTLGKCHLWFGVRHRKHDHFFRDMFQQYVEQGILTAVHTSFSHDDPAVFETVPMLMGRNPAAVWDILRHKDACVYYCGPAMGIPKTCTDAMTRACVTAGGMSEAQAIDHFKAMVTEERWRMECF